MSEHSQAWVLLTGFGPFSTHRSNPSWSTVQEVPGELSVPCTSGTCTVRVAKKELPVAYTAADKLYSGGSLAEYGPAGEPMLVVHVGVNGNSSHVELESCARNCSTTHDIHGFCPVSRQCDDDDAQGCHRGVDLDLQAAVDAVCDKRAKDGHSATQILVSQDAGHFLCNHVYYKGCKWAEQQASRVSVEGGIAPSCVFVHVPVEGLPYSVSALASILQDVVVSLCDQKLQGAALA